MVGGIKSSKTQCEEVIRRSEKEKEVVEELFT